MTPAQGIWPTVRLGAIAGEIKNGLPAKPENTPPGLPILRISAVRPGRVSFDDIRYHRGADHEAAHYELRNGDLLFIRFNGNPQLTAACGMVRSTAFRCVYPDKLIRVRLNADLVMPEFIELAFLLPEIREQLQGFIKTAAGQHGISGKDLREIVVSLPPLPEQRRIVARIEALFARTRRARTDLERIAPLAGKSQIALLRAGVTGRLTEAWRSSQSEIEPIQRLLRRTPAPSQPRGGREATTSTIPGTAVLSVNDPGTATPPGWAWVPLVRVARQESGHTPSRNVTAYWGGDVPWIGIRDAAKYHGKVIYDTAQHPTELGIANSSARLLPTGTVCLSRTASVGYVTIMGRPMATSQDFVTWTCTAALLPEFLKYALLAEGDDIRRFGEGSTHTTIYFPEIRALHICLPPLQEQSQIIRILEKSLGAETVANHEATRTLALLDRLEQSILTRAFRGELVPQDPSEADAGTNLAAREAMAPAAPRRRGRPRT